MDELERSAYDFMNLPRKDVEDKVVRVKAGDVVVRKLAHSCDVRFVEDADETGILLVNGITDRFYEPNEFESFYEEYELLVKKEDRLDSFV